MARRETPCGSGLNTEFQYQGESCWSIGMRSSENEQVFRSILISSSQGSFVKYIQSETSTRVQIKGLGSGFIDQETGQEEPVPLYIHITFVF